MEDSREEKAMNESGRERERERKKIFRVVSDMSLFYIATISLTTAAPVVLPLQSSFYIVACFLFLVFSFLTFLLLLAITPVSGSEPVIQKDQLLQVPGGACSLFMSLFPLQLKPAKLSTFSSAL
ncbi:hypothetical protein L6164_032867 [Bauhinia variegata]|uniref:Uncharacterized protein n=1 Tax=Bauhinia variegata TaxID=167791 RepID=A0ACB9KQD4_BAUVA|nr:hypothetical protein L6164_032867 [Bauhinia variegata]